MSAVWSGTGRSVRGTCSFGRTVDGDIVGDLQQTHGWRHREPITHCVSNQAIFVTTNGQV